MASTNPSGTSNEQFWQGATNPKPPKKRSLLKIIGILAAVLVVAIVVQGYLDMLDHWLVYALLAMVFGKVAARIYAE
jgi:uncharacterized membrane protein YccC